MANRSYLRVWTRDFREDTMLAQFEKLLGSVPFSEKRKGFSSLLIRAIGPAETPLVEWDLRSGPAEAASLMGWMREHQSADCAYEAGALWDVWTYDNAAGKWQMEPVDLMLSCIGPDYDGGMNSETGNFQADVGFEHNFTGHAGMLGRDGVPKTDPQHPVEAVFLERMRRPENLREYHEKTLLWSEGEENFEARLDEILSVR